MLKRITLSLYLLTVPAFAQAPATPDPRDVGMANELMECVSGKVALRSQIARLEMEIAKLKAPPEEKKP